MSVGNPLYPTFGLYFRRYAPFDTFGGFIAGQRNEGDKRTTASTSLKVTARTYGFVMFNQAGIVEFHAGTTGTTFHPLFFADIFGIAKVSTTIVDHTLFHGPRTFLLSASTASPWPLTPAALTPDINTIVNVFVDFSSGVSLSVSGEVWGDNFPNLEVFLVCYRSMHTALLIDGRTTGNRDFGPLLRLRGTNEDCSLGKFYLNWALNKKGEAVLDSTVKPTTLGACPIKDDVETVILDRMSD